MIILLLVLVGTGILLGLVDGHGEERVMREFCELECKQNIKGKYQFCC
jgi:hypothetical protein